MEQHGNGEEGSSGKGSMLAIPHSGSTQNIAGAGLSRSSGSGKGWAKEQMFLYPKVASQSQNWDAVNTAALLCRELIGLGCPSVK